MSKTVYGRRAGNYSATMKILAATFTVALAMLSDSAYALTQRKNGVTWEYITHDGEAGILSVPLSTKGAITVPSTLGGFPVTGVFWAGGDEWCGWRGFRGCSGITSITFPNTITRIGSNAFNGCSNLRKIVFLGQRPMVFYDTFDGLKKSCKIYVPKCRYPADVYCYKDSSAYWTYLRRSSWKGEELGRHVETVDRIIRVKDVNSSNVRYYFLESNGSTERLDWSALFCYSPYKNGEGVRYSCEDPEYEDIYDYDYFYDYSDDYVDADGSTYRMEVFKAIKMEYTEYRFYYTDGWRGISIPGTWHGLPIRYLTTYKVAFYANGGMGNMSVQSFTYGKAKKLSANKFTKKGYTFKGWAKSKTLAKKGKVAYRNKQAVKNLVATGKTAKLYAVWKKKSGSRASNSSGTSGTSRATSGKWSGVSATGQVSTSISLSESGGSISGSLQWPRGDTRSVSGTHAGRSVTLRIGGGDTWVLTYSGTKLSGTGYKAGGGTYKVTLTRN